MLAKVIFKRILRVFKGEWAIFMGLCGCGIFKVRFRIDFTLRDVASFLGRASFRKT
jgi:hypothetical protein